MPKSDIEYLRGNYTIIRSNQYVVAYGKNLSVFSLTGSLIYCRNDINNVFKVSFIQESALLIDSTQYYSLISLVDGSDLWKVKQSKREYNVAMAFALSPCGKAAYDLYTYKAKYYMEKIDLYNGRIEKYAVKNKLRAVVDVCCDPDGEPAILQTHYSMILNRRVSKNGVYYPSHDSLLHTRNSYWMNQWVFEGAQISYCFWENAESVITTDFHIYYHKTGKSINLLENESTWQAPALRPADIHIDYSKQFLILKYSKSNVVLDINSRCVVAKYAGEFTHGCIVGEEYWISSASGVLRKRFPIMEE